ncbi:MAG TPA: hypothetical protein VGF81_08545 [Solirubrobacteraceae bacterium]|jgi:hypothetical protein
MRRLSRGAGWTAIVLIVLSVAAAGAALAAKAGGYQGKTSQRQNLSFNVSRGMVHSFKIVVHDGCPDGHTLIVHASYPAMAVRNGSFGGLFKPVGGHPGEQATLSGKFGRRGVTGNVHDASFSPREKRLCHGNASFSAHHS